MLNIGWLSNSGRAMTGYGNQTRLFTELLAKMGYPVSIFAFYGQEGHATKDDNGIITYPRLVDGFMHDVIRAHMIATKAELLITLMDAFVLQSEIYGTLPWCAWCPEDSEPAKPDMVEMLKAARWVWAMSRFGQKQFEAAGLGDKLMYVPHGVNTDVFQPVNREEARAAAGKILNCDLTGKFLILMNAANKGSPSRKGFAYALEAFKYFSADHPEAMLALHTEAEGFSCGGEHLPTMIETLGVDPAKVVFPQQYPYVMAMFGENHLNNLYNAADVLLNCSLGEGFGIPIVEAQAAGCPVIVTDFSSMPELCFGGWRVPGTRFYTAHYVQQMIPNVHKMLQAMRRAYELRGEESLRAQARAGAVAYDYRTVYERYMKPALERIAGELEQAKTPALLPLGEGSKDEAAR